MEVFDLSPELSVLVSFPLLLHRSSIHDGQDPRVQSLHRVLMLNQIFIHRNAIINQLIGQQPKPLHHLLQGLLGVGDNT